VLFIEGMRDKQVDDLVIGDSSAVLFLLVLFGMAGLVRQVQTQAAKLETLSDTDELTGAEPEGVVPTDLVRARPGQAGGPAVESGDHRITSRPTTTPTVTKKATGCSSAR
jgi:hypothetical protein